MHAETDRGARPLLAASLALVLSVAGTSAWTQEGSGEVAPAPDTSLVRIDLSPIEPAEEGVGALRTLTVSLDMPPGWAVSSLSLDERYHVELVTDELLAPDPGTTQITHRLAVRSFRAGTHRVPGLTVRGLDDGGRAFIVNSAPFEVVVRSVIANESDPQPAPSDGLIAIRIPDRRPLYAGIGLLAAMIGALGWALWRRSQRLTAPPPPPPPPRPADEVALERLAALEGSGRIERGEHLDFHHELSEILRRYFGDTFGFDGVERTTAEVRAELITRGEASARWEARVIALLADTDMVKFARWSPPEATSRQLLHEARELVLDVAARTPQEQPAGDAVPTPSPATDLPDVPDSPGAP